MLAHPWRRKSLLAAVSAAGLAIVVAGVSGPAALASPVTITASDDTWIRSDNVTSNRVGDDFMNARSQDGGTNDVVLLRFDVSTLPLDAESATLNLYWHRTDGTSARSLSLYGLNDGAPGETTWSQSTVNYENAPGVLNVDPVNTQDLDLANLTLLVDDLNYPGQNEGELFTFSGDAIADFINADTNGEVTFLIVRDLNTSGNQARFVTSRATSTATGVLTGDAGFLTPYLEITLIPEPTSAVLLGLGGLALAGMRRRRG